MFFQISVTPPRAGNGKANTSVKVNNYNLLLAPFQPPTRIKLDTKINSPTECELTIRNTNNRNLTVTVCKVPPEERCIHLSGTEWSIPSDSSVTLTIKWEPKEEGSWRDVLQLLDSRRIKYDVPLILTSTNPNKAAKNKTGLRRTKIKTNAQPVIKRTRADVADKENKSNNVGFNWMLEQAKVKKQKKEEQSSTNTLDFSKFLDSSSFKFTPLKSKLQNSIQFITNESSIETKGALRKDTYVTIPKFLNVDQVMKEKAEEKFDDSLSPKSSSDLNLDDIKFTPFKKPANADINTPKPSVEFDFDDIKFTPFKSSVNSDKNSPKIQVDLDFDDIKFTPIKSSAHGDSNATFEIDTVNETDHNSTYELKQQPKSPLGISSRNLQIEFSTPLPTRRNGSNLFSKSQIDCGSAKDCLQADLWVKSKSTCLSPISSNILHSTMESIREEKSFDPSDSPTKAMCLEISPPKKRSNLKMSTVRRISPTKKVGGGKVLKERAGGLDLKTKKKIQNNHTTIIKIPGVRIAKLSLSKCIEGKPKKKETSVKLHDPNDFLTMFCNPDPFAATMTCDPFLASTLYYDDKWMFIQELEFKKWLNALLTPPEHLSADVESIDIGKVWQCCRAKEDVILAETKESISARYHTNTRLNTLRKAACLMFRKPEVITALSQTTVGIEKEILIVRPDKDLHRDIGLQKLILELFISYNPLWLRIGLETIYGETIPLESNSDLIGLSRFLLNRFFSDPFIVKHHSASSHPNIRLASFQAVMNKFMLKKFLFLVYFLDYAKRNKLIGHDPCLFRKKAEIKDSRSILLTFSRETLSGIGDVTKVLRNYSYVVSHKQTYLDEYDYAVTNLCTDLRDGVRLCRLMELVAGGKKCLTCRCRVPAISRLQKVHNVNVALTTLKETGYTITGDIDAKSIADGHREKTLSLLWQIIYKYQRPRFENAAKILQRWWRAKLWPLRIKMMLANRRHEAAARIQRAWRCRQAKRRVAVLRKQRALEQMRRTHAARVIQLRWRLVRKERMDRSAALKIQTWWRRILATRDHVRELKRTLGLIVAMQRLWRAKQYRTGFLDRKIACLKIQTWWRCQKAVREYRAIRLAAIQIQARWKMILQRRRFLAQKSACLKIQTWWRSQRAAQKYRAIRSAALEVQARWKMLRERRRYLARKNACLKIQTWWRSQRAVRQYRATRMAAVRIQTNWRMLRERRRYLEQKSACLKIQTWWRCVKAAREYRVIKSAVLKIQTRWRMIRERRRYLVQKNACLKIQTRWRSIKAAREYRAIRLAALKVQTRWRMLRERRRYLVQKNACLKMQTWWRSQRAARQYGAARMAALRIQTHWRMLRVRRQYLAQKSACLKIQTWWRSQRAVRQYGSTRMAALRIQTHWRMLRERRRYLAQKSACLKIQTWWRSVKAARKYQAIKLAALKIQTRWRMLRERRRYLAKKNACLKIQTWWRSQKAIRQYRATRLAVLKIQTHWRMLIQRRRYLAQKNACLKIQTWWRSQKAARDYRTTRLAAQRIQAFWRMQRQQRIYLAQKNACLKIQTWWRSQKAIRDYGMTRSAALKIQTRWRMLLQRRRYLAQKSACLKIQSHWRAKRAVREYQAQKNACLKIQTWWRARIAVRKYHATRSIIIRIQKHWRTQLLAKRDRERFEAMKNACLEIQTWWRCRRATREYRKAQIAALRIQTHWRMLRQRRLFLTQRDASMKIQTWWRKQRAVKQYRATRLSVVRIQSQWRMLQQRRNYWALLRAALKIQTWWRCQKTARQYRTTRLAVQQIQMYWRAHLLARQERERYETQRNACIKIQSWWRGQQKARDYKAIKSATLKAQARWRMLRVRRSYLVQKNACLKIQTWWRCQTAVQHYYVMKYAALIIQTQWRMVRERRRYYELMLAMELERIEAATKIQRFWRLLLERRAEEDRQRQAVRIIENWWISCGVEICRERRIQKNAAVKIQAIWRGFKVRRSASNKLAVLRSRAEQAAKDAVPTATLAFRFRDNIEKFRYASNIGQLSVCLSSLDVLVRLLPNACVEVCQLNFVPKLYDILAQANRSVPWLEVCSKDVSILLTLAKFKPTNEYVLNFDYIETLARLLTISSDKNKDLFLNTATLMWVLTENSEYAEAVKSCPRSRYLLQSLYTTTSKKHGKSTCKEEILPSPNPDWGLRNKRPRTFNSIAQAIVSLASRLNMIYF